MKQSRSVVAYYCLSTGAVIRADAPSKLRRNAPDPLPLMLIGRLAVDQRHSGRGLGGGLLKDALLRVLQVSQTAGCRAVLVHAIDDAAMRFYARYGFIEFPSDSRTMFLPVETLRKLIY